MKSVHVLNQNFTLEGVIDTYESLIWRPAYSNIGDFELYIPASKRNVELLQKNRFLVRHTDITVDSDGVTTYKKVMIIKNLQLTTNVETGDFITVTGKELKYLLHQRIVWTQTNLSGTVEDCIRRLLDENIINPKSTFRKISNFTLAPKLELTETMDKQLTGDYLDAAVTEICQTHKYGWDIYIEGDNFIFELYTGVDRSYNQADRPYVVYGDKFDNLFNSDYIMKSENYANICLIGGEGEGTQRIYTTTADIGISGIHRFEAFIDARDVSQNKGTDDEIPLDDYKTLLFEVGSERMSETSITEEFTGDILNDNQYVYGKDFYLGDIVSICNTYGIQRNVTVSSLIECDDINGTTLVPQFEY